MENALYRMRRRRACGVCCGMPSYCTANELVIEAVLEQALRTDDEVLIEATANQVNQNGGYTGMRPMDFKSFVYDIAERVGFPTERLLLGGDHLGPLVWAALPEAEAMEQAKLLVRAYVLAGFQKIHLDTSMRLADDLANQPLTDEVIARRGAELCAVCEEAFLERKALEPSSPHPLYVIGSEVPVPGGSQETEDSVRVTSPAAVKQTLETYRKVFETHGLAEAFTYVIAVVVQPGVEFGDAEIHPYDRREAEALCRCVREWPDLVMEGHSTDYQSAHHLREMVEDGIAILKVGPALTFALREGLFALSYIEREMLPNNLCSDFIGVLEQEMVATPEHWEKHYRGTPQETALKRKYSYSDRCRYYLTRPRVQAEIQLLFEHIDRAEIPMGLLRQYLPIQYRKVRDGQLALKARELVKNVVAVTVESYLCAAKGNGVA